MRSDHYNLLDQAAKHLAAVANGGDVDPRRAAVLANSIRNAQSASKLDNDDGTEHTSERSHLYMPRPNRLLRVPNTVTIAANSLGGVLPIKWPCRIRVFGVLMSTIEGTTASLAALTVKITKKGGVSLFTDGQAAAFGSLSAAQIPGVFINVGYFPLNDLVDDSQGWTCQFQNESAAVGATPVLQFAYEEMGAP